jgi:hypothetical protein
MDVDGTAVPHREKTTPNPRVVEAIKKAKKYISISVATSRPLFIAGDVIRALGVNGPCAVNDATQLYDPIKKEIIDTVYLPSGAPEQIKEIFEQKNQSFLVNIGKEQYSYVGGKLPQNICCMCIPDLEKPIAEAIINAITSKISVSAYMVPAYIPGQVWVTVTNAKATKLHSVVKIAELLGIKTSEIIGIGDHYNDFALLEACGLKVAMGNAIPELKAIADFIAPTVEEDGVATVIEKFILASGAH